MFDLSTAQAKRASNNRASNNRASNNWALNKKHKVFYVKDFRLLLAFSCMKLLK